MRTTTITLLTTLIAAGCSVDKAATPPVTGPSEFSLSVTASAIPDQLPRDGSAQSIVTVVVRDAIGRPVVGQRLSLSSTVGSLSEKEIVTDSGGRASFVFTAPGPGSVGNEAIISVLPVGENGGNAVSRTVSVLLLGVSNRTAPAPQFTFRPEAPEVGASVIFDGSKTTDEDPTPGDTKDDDAFRCGDTCTYIWDFGGGIGGRGRIISHRFMLPGSYTVSLVVIDAAGSAASTAQSVTVKAVDRPSVTIAVAPAKPVAGQQTTFTADAKVASGHTVQQYQWDFGDGSTAITGTPVVTKTYTALGTYAVAVTVTDDLGQVGVATLTITVVSGITFPTPPFSISPSDPVKGQTVTFNAPGITASGGATITEYTWDFGDGTAAQTTTSATISYTFTEARTYVVRLTVKDSQGRTETAVPQNVTVKAP